ncbi:MAG: 2-hydroxyacid dehydrogenase [Candidatus Heimdallarchaeota archaeon]
MKIIVVDNVYLEEKHIQRLQSLGDLEVYSDLPKTTHELIERIEGADIAIVGWSQFTSDVINKAKILKMIAIWATTCHYVDLETARVKGIVVCHCPGYGTDAVAEHTIALLLTLIRQLPETDKHVRSGKFDWRPFSSRELAGKTLGIIGTGKIGLRVAEISKAFKMQILAYDKYPNLKKAKEIGMKYVDMPTLLKESDIITLHVTLTVETVNLIGKKEIAAMKDGAIIINTSQGKVIDEKALIDALQSRKLSGAGLDVFREEPPAKDNPLFKLENTILSPHTGFHTVEAIRRKTDILIDNIVKFIEDQPQNICQPIDLE